MLGQRDCGLGKYLELGGELKYFRLKSQKYFIWKIMNAEFFASLLARIRVTGFELWQPFLPTVI